MVVKVNKLPYSTLVSKRFHRVAMYRDTKIGFLRSTAIPDPPTLFPQVLPSKEQQLHEESDLKSLLKKPYVTL